MNQQHRCHQQRCHQGHHSHGHKNGRRGPSSFWMHDPKRVFTALQLQYGDRFLDMGCGSGDYAFQAAKIVGDTGTVCALDQWKTLIEEFTQQAETYGFRNIKAMVADLTNILPVEEDSIDVCFLATVLHSLDLEKNGDMLFNEIHRVLKPMGRLAIIECQKENSPFGPPMHMRFSPEELEQIVPPYGFEMLNVTDLGYNYLIQFKAK